MLKNTSARKGRKGKERKMRRASNNTEGVSDCAYIRGMDIFLTHEGCT